MRELRLEERFDKFKTKFQTRKEAIENKLNQSRKPIPSFYNQKALNIELATSSKFLRHLQSFKQKTDNLIVKNPENTIFYENHLDAVFCLLENIEEKFKKPETLKVEDFKLIVSPTVRYQKTLSDNISIILYFCAGGAIAGAILAGIFGFIAGFMIGVAEAPATAGIGLPYGIAICGTICALVCAIAGALVGAVLGLLIGIIAAPFLKEPLGNEYLNGTAFDAELLRAAYVELSKNQENEIDHKVDINADDTSIELIQMC